MYGVVNFDGLENVAGLSLGILLIGVFMRLIVWFVSELRSQVATSHTRQENSEVKADMLQDKFADESAARARLEVEVQFLSASLKAGQVREIALSREIDKLKEEIVELRHLLDTRDQS